MSLHTSADFGPLVCIGITSKGPCTNPIAASNVADAFAIVEKMDATRALRFENLRPRLQGLAEKCLCSRNHRDQAAGIADVWYDLLDRHYRNKEWRPETLTKGRRSEPELFFDELNKKQMWMNRRLVEAVKNDVSPFYTQQRERVVKAPEPKPEPDDTPDVHFSDDEMDWEFTD